MSIPNLLAFAELKLCKGQILSNNYHCSVNEPRLTEYVRDYTNKASLLIAATLFFL